ncbi:MAG: GAF domain-containing SpoIIE family protein phosphatase [bacterium]
MSSDPEGEQRLTHLEGEVNRLKSAIQELTVLNDLATAASSSLEVSEVLDLIVEKSIKAVKAEQGSILLLTEQEESPLKTLIRQQDRSRLLTYKVGTNITGWVLKHQQPLIIDDLAADERFNTTEQERQEIRSVLCVPIRLRSKLIGILMVTNKKTFEPFNSDDLRLLSIIAAQSGQLIRNSQLQQETLEKKRMEHELTMARNIQRGLLPKKIPEAANLDIASYFNAADEVSGDYYDYFDLGDSRIGIVMADVSGHGASSALVMTMVKGVLQAIKQNFISSDRTLHEMNVILGETIPKDMFVTMMFLVFDFDNMVLKYSNAGHNPLMFYNQQSKCCELLELRAPALSISNLAVYEEKEIPLNEGDLFVIYTDGVTETFNEDKEMFEETRFLQAVREVASEQAGATIEHVKKKLHEFMGDASQSDDVAMIAVKIK